eukprot:GHVL01035016.1.p1 GENE.GHVL01035016.1~~GHVL01035016.1.p1  ORF type:complete len:290 (+),score=87.01 GHVL01035016.1:197-1066(+)
MTQSSCQSYIKKISHEYPGEEKQSSNEICIEAREMKDGEENDEVKQNILSKPIIYVIDSSEDDEVEPCDVNEKGGETVKLSSYQPYITVIDSSEDEEAEIPQLSSQQRVRSFDIDTEETGRPSSPQSYIYDNDEDETVKQSSSPCCARSREVSCDGGEESSCDDYDDLVKKSPYTLDDDDEKVARSPRKRTVIARELSSCDDLSDSSNFQCKKYIKNEEKIVKNEKKIVKNNNLISRKRTRLRPSSANLNKKRGLFESLKNISERIKKNKTDDSETEKNKTDDSETEKK